MLLLANLTLQHMATIHSPFSSQLIMSNFCSIPIVFHRFFTWIAVGDVYLFFSLVTKANAVEGALHQQRGYITNVIYLYRTDGMTVMSLSASLQHKAKAAMDRVCHTVLHQKLSHKFKKLCKF